MIICAKTALLTVTKTLDQTQVNKYRIMLGWTIRIPKHS